MRRVFPQSIETFADPNAGRAKQKGGWPDEWPATLGERIHDILTLMGATDRKQWCVFGFEGNRAFSQQLEDVVDRYQVLFYRHCNADQRRFNAVSTLINASLMLINAI